MAWRICLNRIIGKDVTNRLTVCFDIPYWVDTKFFPPNPPDPPIDTKTLPQDPVPLHPTVWAHGKDIPPGLSQHLSVLATIDALANGLAPTVRDSIQKQARGAIGQVPEGLEVTFHAGR